MGKIIGVVGNYFGGDWFVNCLGLFFYYLCFVGRSWVNVDYFGGVGDFGGVFIFVFGLCYYYFCCFGVGFVDWYVCGDVFVWI